MAVYLERRWDEAQVSESLLDRSSRASLRYIATGVYGVDTEESARLAAALYSPPTYGSLVRSSINVLARLMDGPVESKWDLEVGYTHPDQKEQPKPSTESEVYFEVRGGGGTTIQRTYSEALVEEVANLDAYKFSGTDVEKILGLKAADADNGTSLNAQGVPFKQASIQVVMHAWRANSTVMGGYLLDICDACERQVTNAGPFKSFPAGSLQFIDFSAQQKAGRATYTVGGQTITINYDAGWDFTFTFLFGRKIRPSVPGLPAFTKDKLAHEYLDVLFMPELIPVKNVVVAKPVRAAIHKIYETEFFHSLFRVN